MTTYGRDFRHKRTSVERIVDTLLADMTQRLGFNELWEDMPESVRHDWRQQWITIVKDILSR